jgi:site-specific DNA recombinase
MKCAIYIRVSTNKEEQKASLSLENQRELFLKYISDKGWDIHNFYVDVESGTTDKREQLQKLISMLRLKSLMLSWLKNFHV